MPHHGSGSDAIGQVVITCLTTGRWLYVGVAMSSRDFVFETLGERIVAQCPHCGRSHRWTKNDAALEGPWPTLPAAHLGQEPHHVPLP